MPDPRRLAARKAIASALGSIPGVAAESIYRDPVDLETLPQNNLPAFVIGVTQPLVRNWNRGAQEGGRAALSWILDEVMIPVWAAVDASGGGQGPADDASETMLAAIETALTPDDYTFGGLVTEIRLRQPQSAVYGIGGAVQRVIILQELEVSIYRQFGVP